MKKIWFALLLALAPLPVLAANDLNNVYQGYAGDTQMALTQPHRSTMELGSWLSDTVADSLQYTPRNAATKLSSIRPEFSEQGYKAYVEFLTAQGFADALQKQTLTLTSIVNNAPMLIGQGASAGRYAWAFEMPVVLSANVPGQASINRSVTLRIQIGRSPQGVEPNGVLIESWQVYNEPGADAPADGANPPSADGSGKPAGAP